MTTEPLNARHWRDGQRGVYEVWYLTWNHPNGTGYWLRYTTDAPSDGEPAIAELWFARFDPARPDRTFGVHRRFDAIELVAEKSPFEIAIGASRLGHDRAIGELTGDGHDIRWDLRWDPAGRELRQLPDVMYARGGLGETTVVSPNPRVWMSGRVEIDGEVLDFHRAVLGQTHLWGKKHALSWTWARCAEFADAPDGVLELLGVKLQRRGVTLPTLVVATLDLDGERHQFNQFRHTLGNRGTWRTGRAEFTLKNATTKVEGEFVCSHHQLVEAPYLDPDGTRVYCANTEIGDARLVISKRAGFGWREVRRLESAGRAHFETGGRERDRAVVHEHVLVQSV